jgi:hypothetical protein
MECRPHIVVVEDEPAQRQLLAPHPSVVEQCPASTHCPFLLRKAGKHALGHAEIAVSRAGGLSAIQAVREIDS